MGVARQWCGRLGKVENCQVGVYMAYVSRKEHALVNTRLYLPEEWTKDRARRKEAGVPKAIKFRTRHELALEMLDERGGRCRTPGSPATTRWAVPRVSARNCAAAANVTCWRSPRTR